MAAVSTTNHLDVLGKLVELYQDIYAHDGYGEIRVEVRIQHRGQKEIILHCCGKQYRYVLDINAKTTLQLKDRFAVIKASPWHGSMSLEHCKDDRRSGVDRRVQEDLRNFKPGRRKGVDRRVALAQSYQNNQAQR